MTIAACWNGGYIYSVSDGGVNIFNDVGRWIQSFRDPDFRFFDIQSSGVPGRLLVCGGTPGVDGKVGILTCEMTDDIKTGDPFAFRLQTREVCDDLLYRCRFDRSRSCVYAAGADFRVYRMSIKENGSGFDEVVRIASMTSAVHAMDLHESSGLLAVGGRGGEMSFINLDSDGTTETTAQYIADHTAGVTSIAVPPGGEYVISGSADARIRVHKRTGRLVLTVTGIQYHTENQTLEEHMRQTSVLCLATLTRELEWNPDSGGIVAGTSNGAIFHISGGKSEAQLIHKPHIPPGALPSPTHQILVNQGRDEVLIPQGMKWMPVRVSGY